LDNVLSTIGSNWKDLPDYKNRIEWRIFLEGNPAKMSWAEKDLWLKAKQEIVSKNVVITPNLTGGTLV
jgi:hypothetical protein